MIIIIELIKDKHGFGTTKTRASEFLYHKGYESERKYGPFGNYNKKYEEYVGQGIERVEWEINLNLMKEDWLQTEEDRRFIEALRNNQSNYS